MAADVRPRLRDRLIPVLVALTALTGIAVASAPIASAHPLGNFTVNYYSGIRVEPRAVEVLLVVDRAEIPTLQAFPDAATGQQPDGADSWRVRQCAQLAGEATLQMGGVRVPLSVTSSRLEILAGVAGLSTSRLECSLRSTGSLDVVGQSGTYRAPASSSDRVGWHEITATGNGTSLAGSDAPQLSVSKELTLYPEDLLTSPLDQRTARFEVRPGSGVVGAENSVAGLSSSPLRGLDRFTNSYTDLVSRTTLTPGFALLAIVLSMLLGALHAFAPGHGKTLMAAYLVGREGTWRQAAVIGVSVTVTHTLGVLLLGIALSAAALAAPEQVYPWLGLISGVLLAAIGATLLRSARNGHVHGPGGHTHGPGGHTHGASEDPGRASPVVALVGVGPASGGVSTLASAWVGSGHELERRLEHELEGAHGHGHEQHALGHDHGHEQHGHGHEQAHGHEHPHAHGHEHGQSYPLAKPSRRGSWRLAAVGLAGGLVPSPSALLVLLGGIALGRAWFGALLVLFYGIGMASALVGTGLLLVLARDRFEQWSALRPNRPALPGQVVALRLTHALPTLTAIAVMTVGAWIAIRSVMTI